VLAAEISRFRPCLLLLQHHDDLLFRKSLLLHVSVLNGPDSNPFWRKFSVAGQSASLAISLPRSTEAIAVLFEIKGFLIRFMNR
jgi:hypothetical protein